jgi:hypothetical protein
MVIFILGVILAAMVATTYLTLGARDFQRIRREVNRPQNLDGAEPPSTPVGGGAVDPAKETAGFAWRALGGVITSVVLLYTISHVWWAWYVFPALALGTGVAVSVAFVIDPTRASS